MHTLVCIVYGICKHVYTGKQRKGWKVAEFYDLKTYSTWGKRKILETTYTGKLCAIKYDNLDSKRRLRKSRISKTLVALTVLAIAAYIVLSFSLIDFGTNFFLVPLSLFPLIPAFSLGKEKAKIYDAEYFTALDLDLVKEYCPEMLNRWEQAVYDYTIRRDIEAREYAHRVLFMANKRAKHADWETLNKSLKVQQEVENNLLENVYKDMA